MSSGWCMGATVKILLFLCYFVFRGDTIFRGNTEFHTMETSPSENKSVIYFSYMAASESEEYQREKQARLISGALSYAVSKINNDTNLLPNHTLAFKWSDTLSDELEVLRQMCHSWTDKVYAFFGPETYCGVAARLAAAWNTPMISYKCATHEVSNKTIYPTFARTFPPANQVTKFIVSLLKHHNWTQYSLVVGSSNRMMDIKSKLVQLSSEYDLSIINITTYKEPYIPIVGNSEIPGIVNNTYPHTRIYVFLGDQNGIVDFLCNLYYIGVLDGGKYIVIYIDHMPYNPKGSLKYFKKAMDNPSDNLNCGAAARSLLVMAPQPPSNRNYTHFEKMVNLYNKEEPFNFPDPFAAGKQVPLFAAHLYDAVYLYAECIHNMLLENLNIRNGTDVINRIRNKRFQSIQGFQCLIDDNGDALGNYSLLAWKEDYSPNREANFTMYPVGSFIIDPNKTLPNFKLNKDSEIAWINGGPPKDEPDCGFYNERCIKPKDDTAVIILSVLGGVSVLTIVIFIILYKKWRYEQAIAGLLWKICSPDLHIDSDKPECKSESKYSLGSRLSLDSRTTMTQVYARTGNYKGQIVALKMYEKKNFVVTHKMKIEMKMMRDIRHGNVNAFIGACVDPPHFIIVTEYCSRGSLQDVLENEDMKLDDMFIASLVKDLIQGMIVIHESELGYHGNLKSSNCVISSRWTLQVTDYGILQIRAATYRREDEHAYFRNLQWTAPEILRNSEEKKRTPKGDVYSFGIVLYEILGRCSPYRDLNITPKGTTLTYREIIERIEKNHELIRPNLDVLNCDQYLVDCMKNCWNEYPEMRPDFRSVWRMLKPMRQGTKRNIFDNMMAIMERYQCNLEELVSERTEQLIEEKKKTEMLLHRMLPKSVAETLKKGLPVKPESYQSVTIYFSDICGFTALSAESTPMQVVDLLNDLYTLFDSIIHHYDVYKVETIGDAYMVVSGIPLRNGDNHAGEIASMSLQLLNAIHTFKIRHKPNEVIKLRVGIHSGQCVAGVVGLIMPRYCLFGDTVNTASRMESNGEALKIHCSETTKILLDKLEGYVLHERGLVNMKGKGEVRTFWLINEDKEVRQRRLAVLRTYRNTRTIYGLQHPRTNSWKRNAFNRRSRETDSANLDLLNTTATANSMMELKPDGSFFEIIRKPDCETNSNLVSSAMNLVSASSPGTVTGKTASMSDFHCRLDTSDCVGAGGERIGSSDAGGVSGNSGDGCRGVGDGDDGGGVDGGASNSGNAASNFDAFKSNVSLHHDLNGTKTQNNPTIMCRACSVKERRSNSREFFGKSHTRNTNLNPGVNRGNNVNLEVSLNDNNDGDSASERDCLLTNQIANKPVESTANVTPKDAELAPMEGQTEHYVEQNYSKASIRPNTKQHQNQQSQQQQPQQQQPQQQQSQQQQPQQQQQQQSSQPLSPQQHQQQQNQQPP